MQQYQVERVFAEKLSGKKESLSLIYEPNVSPEQFRETLEKNRNRDVYSKNTGTGPHRDDLSILLSGMDMRSFASQGQVRTAALSLRLSAFDLLEKTQGEPPLLLLDDVLSELDPDRRRRLLSRISGVQTLLTCTDPSDLTGATPACVIRVAGGVLTEQS